MWAGRSDPLQILQYEKVGLGGEKLHSGETCQILLQPADEVPISSYQPDDSLYCWYDENDTLPLWPSSPHPIFLITVQKHQVNSHRGTFYKTLHQYSSNCQGHQRQGRSEKLSHPRGPCGGMTRSNGTSWMESWDKMDIEEKLRKSEWSVDSS